MKTVLSRMEAPLGSVLIKQELVLHKLKFNCVTKLPSYICLQCGYRSPLQTALLKHNKHFHRPLTAPSTAPVRKYSCICQFKTHSLLIYTFHYKRCRKRRQAAPLRCAKCGFRAKRQSTLDGHVRAQHPAAPTLAAKRRLVLHCRICRRPFRKRKHLLSHIQCKHVAARQSQAAALKPAKKLTNDKCGNCDFWSGDVGALTTHILTNHVTTRTVKSYFCDLCPFYCVVEEDLVGHVLKEHVGVQGAACSMCGLWYADEAALREHILNVHIL